MIPQTAQTSILSDSASTTTTATFAILDILTEEYPLDSVRYFKIHNLTFPVCCSDCGSEMTVINSCRRKPKNSSGQQIPFNLRKFLCPQCGHTHIELPDFLQPHKQYEKAVMGQAVQGAYSQFGMDESSVRYWRGIKKPSKK